MQLSHAMIRLETTVAAQLRLGGEDLEEIGETLLEVLRPAVRQTLMEVVETAAGEITSQLTGQRVDIRIREGDPDLIVVDTEPAGPPPEEPETMEARITLRLPDHLKALIEEAADDSGDSINSWVVNALRTRAQKGVSGSSVKGTIDL